MERTDDDTQRLARLTQRMRELGADNPQRRAASEVDEGIPQQARFLALRGLWEQVINWTPDSAMRLPAAKRLLDAGADPADLVTALRAAAYQGVFAVLDRIDDGYDPDAPADAPGWALMEVRDGPDGAPEPTGRCLVGLHEDILMMDPSGLDGADLWR